MSWRGHWWTVRGFLERRRRRLDPSTAEPWSTEVVDPVTGRLRLTGYWSPADGNEALIILHGMGGSADSNYVRLAAVAAAELGLARLSLNVRGADRRGEDYFHAALTDDLAAAISSPALAGYTRLGLLGYSLGGHLALRYAAADPDPRVAALATLCTPLDLAACCDEIDRPLALPYRRYLLSQLLEIYTAVAARRPVPVPVEEARRIRLQREFDDRIVAPRHGFDGVDDYYRRASAGPYVGRLEVETLMVLAQEDPMVPAASLRPYLAAVPGWVDVRWLRGGHIGFPAAVDLGQEAPLGVTPQVVGWLRARLTSGDGAPAGDRYNRSHERVNPSDQPTVG